MKSFFAKCLIFSLVFTLGLSPRMVSMALAQDKDSAPDEEVQLIQQLAKQGYLGDKKDFYLSAKTLADEDITDALVAIYSNLLEVDLSKLNPKNSPYRVEDLKNLLKLVEDKAEDIRARKVSAWKFEFRVKKMMEALAPATPAASDATPALNAEKIEPTPSPIPTATATATPIPGPNRAEWDEMKGTIKDLSKKVGDLQETYDKKMDALQKTSDDVKSSNADLKEQLKLVKNLMDRVQGDLKKTDDRLDEVAQKASKKSITDTELQQELDIMHKDLRDDTQDVSILKQQVTKLDKTDTIDGQSLFDQILTSKWLGGGALLVGITALVISLTHK